MDTYIISFVFVIVKSAAVYSNVQLSLQHTDFISFGYPVLSLLDHIVFYS